VSNELTKQILESWAAAASATPPDKNEAAESFGEFVKLQLGEGTSPTPSGVAASLQAHLNNNQEN
jgi:hypothetical protein